LEPASTTAINVLAARLRHEALVTAASSRGHSASDGAPRPVPTASPATSARVRPPVNRHQPARRNHGHTGRGQGSAKGVTIADFVFTQPSPRCNRRPIAPAGPVARVGRVARLDPSPSSPEARLNRCRRRDGRGLRLPEACPATQPPATDAGVVRRTSSPCRPPAASSPPTADPIGAAYVPTGAAASPPYRHAPTCSNASSEVFW
jgi:hypothetical protein